MSGEAKKKAKKAAPSPPKTVEVPRKALVTVLEWFNLERDDIQQDDVDKVLPGLRRAAGLEASRLDS